MLQTYINYNLVYRPMYAFNGGYACNFLDTRLLLKYINQNSSAISTETNCELYRL